MCGVNGYHGYLEGLVGYQPHWVVTGYAGYRMGLGIRDSRGGYWLRWLSGGSWGLPVPTLSGYWLRWLSNGSSGMSVPTSGGYWLRWSSGGCGAPWVVTGCPAGLGDRPVCGGPLDPIGNQRNQ
jgi:hypothetical protein